MKNHPLPYQSIQDLEKNTIKYLILKSNYKYRKDHTDVTFKRDVASTLFTYNGEFFGPIARPSLAINSKSGHSERVSLVRAINAAIEVRWKMFQGLTPIIEDIPSIEQIVGNTDLLTALRQLDEIHIFTERKSCDFSQNLFGDPNEPEDNGCVVYLKTLELALNFNNEQIKLYNHFNSNVDNIKVAAPTLKKEFDKMGLFFDMDTLLSSLNETQEQIDNYLKNKILTFSKNDAPALGLLEETIKEVQKEKNVLDYYINRNIEEIKNLKLSEGEKRLELSKYDKILTLGSKVDKETKKQIETILALKQTDIFTLEKPTPQQEKFKEKSNALLSRLKEIQKEINSLEKSLFEEMLKKMNSMAEFLNLSHDEIQQKIHPLAEFIDEIEKDFFEDKIIKLEGSIQDISNELNNLKDPDALNELNKLNKANDLNELLNELKELLNELNEFNELDKSDEPNAPNDQKQYLPTSNEIFINIIKKEKVVQENQLNGLKQQIKIHYEIEYLNLIADKIQEKINNLEKLPNDESSLKEILASKNFLLKAKKEIGLTDNLLTQNKKELPLYNSNKNSLPLIKLKINQLVETSSKLAKQAFHERMKNLSSKCDETQRQIDEFLKPTSNIYSSPINLKEDIERIEIEIKALSKILEQYRIELDLSVNDELTISNLQQKIINQTQVLTNLEQKYAKQSVSPNLAKDLQQQKQLIEKLSEPIDLSKLGQKQPEFLPWKKRTASSIKQSAPDTKQPTSDLKQSGPPKKPKGSP